MTQAVATPLAKTEAAGGHSLGKLAAIAVVLAGLACLPLLLTSYQLALATQILIFAMLAMSVDVLAGYAGRTPLCHGAIFGASTYVVIYATNEYGLALLPALLLGVLSASFLAAVFALLAVRTAGVYFLLLTLALGLVIWGVCLRWTHVTGGENGLRGQLRSGLFADVRVLYFTVLTVSLLTYWAMHRFVSSAFGLTLRGIRDSESRMTSLGYNVPLHVFIAFTVSGFFAGIAGALYAIFNNFVSPSTIALAQSVQGLLMAIVGGIGTLLGSYVGATVIILLEQMVSAYTERWLMVLGAVFVLIMIFAPEGIVGKARALAKRSSS
jgi:branched-chain amino acid transport system permease protein